MSAFERIVPDLIDRARRIAAARLAETHAESAQSWRKPALLWPLFTKD
jgi:hypothetical protein